MQKLIEGIHHFQEENFRPLQGLFEKLSRGQNPETLFMANDLFFSKLQKAVYLLNLSRGKIVETSALVKAMQEGKVIAAGLDVLEYEKTSFEAFNEKKIPIRWCQIFCAIFCSSPIYRVHFPAILPAVCLMTHILI